MQNLKEEQDRIYNQNLYKIYKMISWDLLFYYAVSFLFLTQEKGLSTSQIILADAFYPLFKIVFQIPSTILIEKLGNRGSLILANLSLVAYALIVMGLSSTLGLIIANIFCALGYTIKGVSESNLLYDSIKNSENKRIIFFKIDGAGSSLYYYFDAITAISSGFLFVINPYIPMILCLAFTVLSVVLSYKFKEITVTDTPENPNTKANSSMLEQFKFYLADLKQAFRFISKSNRLRALIMFNAIFVSFVCLIITFRRSVLTELNVPDTYFGIIFAIWGLIAGFASTSAQRIQKSHGNHTLGFLGLTYGLSIIFAGLVAVLTELPPFLVYFLILTLFTIHSVITGPYYTLIKQYLGSFSTSSMRTKILSATFFIESITRTVISFLVSYLTNHLSSGYSTLLLGIIFTIALLIVLSYMKSRVGLKPEEYSDSDIKFNELY